jgi:hypothetical protein
MVRADILDPVTGIVIDTCSGADDEGYCPRQAADGALPCGGSSLEAEAVAVAWRLRLDVPQQARKCPLRGFSCPSA